MKNRHSTGLRSYDDDCTRKELTIKKLFVTVIVSILLVALLGCSSQDKSKYNETTNKQVSFQEIQFQVPKEWIQSDITDEENSIAFEVIKDSESTGLLTIDYYRDGSMNEEITAIEDEWKIAQKENVNISELTKSSSSIANMHVHKIEFDQTVNSEKVINNIIFIQTKKGFIKMMFASNSKVAKNDFNKIVDSIILK